MPRPLLIVLVALALAGAALAAVGGSLSGPSPWSPDGLFYQARALELQGASEQEALDGTFFGPLGAHLREVDPEHSGDPSWVRYNAQFYERRVALPLAATALEPVAGDRALLNLSLAGYVATVLAVFALLLLRFRLPIAAAVTAATVFVPALVHHSSFPLTDSWGLALETAAFACGLLTLERGPRWLIGWAAAILLLAFTRDSTWLPILATLWVTVRYRSKVGAMLFGTAVLATAPVLLLYPAPMRPLLAQMLNGANPVENPTWSFIIERYPAAIVDLVQANGGFVLDGAWYSAGFFLVGIAALFGLTRGTRSTPSMSLLKAGAFAGLAYVLVVPIYSGFRLELVWVPMAAFGLALGAEALAQHAAALRPVRRSHGVDQPRSLTT